MLPIRRYSCRYSWGNHVSQQPPEQGPPVTPPPSSPPPPPPPAGGDQPGYAAPGAPQPPYPPQPPYAGQPPYAPQPPYGGQPSYPPQPRTDGMAIASLVCSLGFLVIGPCGIVTSILAIVFARNADRNIAASGGALGGTGLAKAGRIIGWIGIGLAILAIVFYIAIFVIFAIVGESDTSTALGALG